MDVIKWYLNFVLCNFGVKLYLRFQIKLALCAHSISNHAWDLRPKCTPLSSVNISNRKSHMLLKWHKHILKVSQNMVVLVYRYTKERNINELRHNSMCGYENNRNSPVYRYTRTAPKT